MPSLDYPAPRRRRGRAALRWGLGVLLVAVVFALGVALGEALHDNPRSGGSRTFVRTLRPLPLAPAPATVTVTTTARP
jgi:hypothetical protein